jgi:hypothetical protein
MNEVSVDGVCDTAGLWTITANTRAIELAVASCADHSAGVVSPTLLAAFEAVHVVKILGPPGRQREM